MQRSCCHGMCWARGTAGDLLLPIHKLAELLPATRAGAQRLGLVTLEQMTSALTDAVENPVQGKRIMEVPEIRAACA